LPGVSRRAGLARIVARDRGPANIGITLDVYSHMSPHMQPDAAEKIDAGLRAALAELGLPDCASASASSPSRVCK
jgi:hypothetical protein